MDSPENKFDRRCQTDPQGVISDLLGQISRQAKYIGELKTKIEHLELLLSKKQCIDF